MADTYTPRHTGEQYCLFDPFSGDRDVTYGFRNVRIVTTRTPHECFGIGAGEQHEIPPGTRVRKESAKVDGEIHSSWLCFECADKMVEPDGFCWVCKANHPTASDRPGGEG